MHADVVAEAVLTKHLVDRTTKGIGRSQDNAVVAKWKVVGLVVFLDSLMVVAHNLCMWRVGQNHTYYDVYSIYNIFSREITIHTIIYGVQIQFWPTLYIYA